MCTASVFKQRLNLNTEPILRLRNDNGGAGGIGETMTQHNERDDWRDLWHRSQDGEPLSALEKRQLMAALAIPAQLEQTRAWATVNEMLHSAEVPKLPSSLACQVAQDIQFQRLLSAAPPALPHSIANTVVSDITLSRWFAAEHTSAVNLPYSLAADIWVKIAHDPEPVTENPVTEADPLAALLHDLPKPELPHSLAVMLASQITGEAAKSVPSSSDAHQALPPLGRTRFNPPGGPSGLAGFGVVLVFGGLTVLRGNTALLDNQTAQDTLGLLGSAAPFSLPLPALLGVIVLALLSWLIVARPTAAVQRVGALAFAMTGVLTLPAVWDALQSTPLKNYITALTAAHPQPQLLLERWLGAGLLLSVTALLLYHGWGTQLARFQRRAPLQTLAAGTLAGLGAIGLALLMLSFGWTLLGMLLAFISAGAAIIGLSVSVYAAGRSVARQLHLALPEVSGPLAGLLAFSASLSVPALAASLALIGSAWGLGTLLIGRGTTRI